MSIPDQAAGQDADGVTSPTADETEFEKAFGEHAGKVDEAREAAETPAGEAAGVSAAAPAADQQPGTATAKPAATPGADPNPAADAGESGRSRSGPSQAAPGGIDWTLFENATPEQRTALEALDRRTILLAESDRRQRGRQSTQDVRIRELSRENADLRMRPAAPGSTEPPAARTQANDRQHREGNDGAPAPQGGGKKAADPLKGEKFATMAKDYPEIAGAVAEVVGGVIAENESLRKQVSGLVGKDQNAALEANVVEMDRILPGWDELTARPDFLAWCERQPRSVQQAIARNANDITDPAEAASFMRSYAFEMAPDWKPRAAAPSGQQQNAGQRPAPTTSLTARRERQLNAAPHVLNRGGGGPSGPPDGYEDAFAHYAAKR